MNTYIFLDDNNIVVNVLDMPDEPVDQQLLDSLLFQNKSSRSIRLENGQECTNTCETVDPKNTPVIGSEWINNCFITPKPGENYILDYYGINWVPVPPDLNSEETFFLDFEKQEWVLPE